MELRPVEVIVDGRLCVKREEVTGMGMGMGMCIYRQAKQCTWFAHFQ